MLLEEEKEVIIYDLEASQATMKRLEASCLSLLAKFLRSAHGRTDEKQRGREGSPQLKTRWRGESFVSLEEKFLVNEDK